MEEIEIGIDPDSKLGKFKNYKREYSRNLDLFNICMDEYLDKVDDHSFFEHFNESFSPYLELRISDLLVSVTDDILRYAFYHNIATDDNGLYSVSEPVRAAFFIKWILKTKPCFLDFCLGETKYSSIYIDQSKSLVTDLSLFILCNENLALLTLTIILDIKDKDGNLVRIEDLFDSNDATDLTTLLYSLRYRIYHQDSYTTLCYQLEKLALMKIN